MSGARIPKPGEVWSYDGAPTPVVNVHSDAVTYLWRGDRLVAETLETFIESYTPPEPTVVDRIFVRVENVDGAPTTFTTRYLHGFATHRLDLMSDGEFRVVKL